jgi:hypothetical protein
MAVNLLDKGEREYKASSPARRRFFDVLSSRLSDGEVLFTQEVNAIADDADYNLRGFTEVLRRPKTQAILLHLNVAVGVLLFGGGRAYRRYTCFDRQYPAAELDIEQALIRAMPDYDISVPVVVRAVERWKEHAQYSHEGYMQEVRRAQWADEI